MGQVKKEVRYIILDGLGPRKFKMPEIPAASEIYWPHPVLKDNSSLNVGLTLLLSITSGAGNLNFGLKSYHVFEGETNNKAGNFQNVTESALDYGWIFWLDLLMIIYSLSESCILDGRNLTSAKQYWCQSI